MLHLVEIMLQKRLLQIMLQKRLLHLLEWVDQLHLVGRLKVEMRLKVSAAV
jgi:hypothetical protein